MTTTYPNSKKKIPIQTLFPTEDEFVNYLVSELNFLKHATIGMYSKVLQSDLHFKNHWMDWGIRKICGVCGRFVSLKYWTDRGFTEKKGKEMIANIQAKRSVSGWQKRPMEERKDCNPIFPEYWISRGSSEEEASKMVSTCQKKRSAKSPMPSYMKDPVKIKEYSCMFVEHYLKKGLSVEEAENKVKNNKNKFSANGRNASIKRGGVAQSLVANGFFDELVKKSKINIDEVYGGNFKNEWWIKVDLPNKPIISCDFKYRNKIIEFYGDRFHANPLLFKDSDRPNPYKKDITAEEIRNNDKKREAAIKEKGFELLVIWQQDFLQDKEKTLNIARDFLYEN